MHVWNPSTCRQRQEEQDLGVIVGYRVNLRWAWAIGASFSKQDKRKKKEKSIWNQLQEIESVTKCKNKETNPKDWTNQNNNKNRIILVVWMRMAFVGSHVWMLGHWGVELLERIRRARRCDLDRSMFLRFQKRKKSMPGPDPDSPLLPSDQDVKFSATAPGPYLFASHYDDHGLTSETVGKPQWNVFFYKGWLGHNVSSQK